MTGNRADVQCEAFSAGFICPLVPGFEVRLIMKTVLSAIEPILKRSWCHLQKLKYMYIVLL